MKEMQDNIMSFSGGALLAVNSYISSDELYKVIIVSFVGGAIGMLAKKIIEWGWKKLGELIENLLSNKNDH